MADQKAETADGNDQYPVVTADLIRAVEKEPGRFPGYPLPDLLYRYMELDTGDNGRRFQATVRQVVELHPPSMQPGHYNQEVCPVCHGDISGKESCPRCDGDGAVCRKCRGLGRVYANDWGSESVDCDKCDAEKNRSAGIMRKAWAGWGLTKAEQSWTFENGLWNDKRLHNRPWSERFRLLAGQLQTWARTPGWQGFKWVVMIDWSGKGNFGRGKSYLGTCIIHEIIGGGRYAFKWQVSQLLNWLRDKTSPRADLSFSMWLLSLKNFPGVLFLDELGWEKETDWATEQLHELLTYRAERSWLPTVIAGNVRAGELAGTMPWLSSRLDEPEVWRVRFDGLPDWRKIRATLAENDLAEPFVPDGI